MKDPILGLKTIIRVKDFDASRRFYHELLGFEIIEEYKGSGGESGSQGCIMRIGGETGNALIEISKIESGHYYHQEPFDDPLPNDKVGIQMKTSNVKAWAQRLEGQWETRGPVLRPWGWHYLYLKDPDDMPIIIYQESG